MKRVKLYVLAGIMALSFIGCQTAEDKANGGVNDSKEIISETDGFFENFEHLEFYFSSGAGGWRTILTFRRMAVFLVNFRILIWVRKNIIYRIFRGNLQNL